MTAAYPTGGFSGIYIQTPGTGGTPKAPGDASDGIFVYSSWASRNVEIGDCVLVEGTAGEYNGLTQLTGNPFVTVLEDAACASVVPTALATLPATDAEKEVYEGMLVLPEGTYTITNNTGQPVRPPVSPSVTSRPATDVVAPGPGRRRTRRRTCAVHHPRRRLVVELPENNTAESPLPYLSHDPDADGAQVTFTEPVILDYRFQWNYQPTGQVVGPETNVPVASENDRPATAPALEGNLTIGAFNVLNYFDDLGMDEEGCRYYADMHGNPVATNFCQVRGAYSEQAFQDQQDKLVAAINKSYADILALMEIENSAGVTYLPGQPRDKALATLVDALKPTPARPAGFMCRPWSSPRRTRTSSAPHTSTTADGADPGA